MPLSKPLYRVGQKQICKFKNMFGNYQKKGFAPPGQVHKLYGQSQVLLRLCGKERGQFLWKFYHRKTGCAAFGWN